jgi:hypothetical protein
MNLPFSFRFLAVIAGAPLLGFASADNDLTRLGDYAVYGRNVDLLQQAAASSDGQVGAADLAARPFLRRGELLETIPGVVITQHSGSGKANQYFLRGFNLDHGTDFAASVDGLPVNMRTHAHGQGYADLNFIIPELIDGITYQKGLFSAANGDFSAAGAAQFHLVDDLPEGLARLELGENDFARVVAADTLRSDGGAATTVGVEAAYDNGPWVSPEHSRRFNLFGRHTWTSQADRFALTVMGYRGEWNSSDQIPQRAVEAGDLDRFGTIDPSDGGDGDRISLSFDWTRLGATGDSMSVNLYALRYRLNLFSNFTYFLDDPVNGDQFHQSDERTVAGGSLVSRHVTAVGGHTLELEAGLQTRADWIDVGLFRTAQRAPVSTIRDDDVLEASAALYAQGTLHLSERWRAVAGMRVDGYRFDVDSDNPLNSGRRDAGIVSPKLSLIYQAGRKTELYANAGGGFHSNDARGTVISVDPVTGDPAARVDPLVRAQSVEVGLRTASVHGLVSTVSLWALDLDSELVFVGDAGGTEASGATRRYGVEFANYYRPVPWLALDADLAFTHARYRDEPAGEDYIANSLSTVVTGGATVDLSHGFFGSARARYFGPQPLNEDDSVRAPSSLTVNLRIGWHDRKWEVALEALNLFDRANNDIAYFYASRVPGEPAAGMEDVHFHPAEPLTVRASVMRRF